LKKINPKNSPPLGGIKGRGMKMVIMHPHPSPLPSRERGNLCASMSIFGIEMGIEMEIDFSINYN